MTIFTLQPKTCMAKLLLQPVFDSFSFIEGEINTYNQFQINGYLQKEFFEEAPGHEYSYWGDVREFCFEIIRGKRSPLNFRFILSLAEKDFPAFLENSKIEGFYPEQIQGLYLNFRYDGAQLFCTTGTSLKTFTLDKTLEQGWDRYVQKWFDEIGVCC